MDKSDYTCLFRPMLESLHHTISQKVSEIFDLYTDLHGIRITLFGPEGRLIYPDSEGRPNCRHCSMLRDTLGMDYACRELDHKMMKTAFDRKDMITYTCHAGMREATAPLLIEEELVGFVMLGQFRSEAAPTEAPYAERWRAEQNSDELQIAFNETPVFHEEKITTLLSMFQHLMELIVGGQLIHHKDYDLIAPVIERMKKEPETGLSLDEASRIIGRSPSTVSRLFKKTTGRSFKQYQVWFRMDAASNMLISNPMRPVSEIAEAVGFVDPLYFSRLFRKHIGCSPREFRTQSSASDGN